MLHLATVADDEPGAPIEAKAPRSAAKPGPYDARELSRKAVASWGLISPHLYDRRGFRARGHSAFGARLQGL